MATVAGQSRYVLSQAITQVINIINRTSGVRMKQRTLAWMRERDRATTPMIGTPTHYAFLNESGVVAQPSAIAAGNIRIVSTAPTDTMVFTLDYQATSTTPGPHEVYSAALAGTAPVTIAPAVNVIHRLTLAAVPTGVVTLSQTAPALTLAQIAPNTAFPMA